MKTLVALLISASMVAAVNASPSDGIPTIAVKYDPQSITTESGARELYRRIVNAARQVCPDDDVRDLQRTAVARRCRDAAVARAVSEIHEPHLVEIAAGHAKRG